MATQMKVKHEINQAIVRRLFNYDEEEGILVRKVTIGGQMPGTMAGYKQVSNGRKWVAVKVMGGSYPLHRVVWLWMTGEFPENEIDHINGDATDNRWSNLRHVTHQENCKNLPLLSTNKTGISGVHWHYRDKAWVAAIPIKGKRKQLYHGQDFFEACCRRKAAELVRGYHHNHGRKP